MQERRPDPDALLQELGTHDSPARGTLKIFFGYAAGVGKTYAMLQAAQAAKQQGVDVVAGYIEPHGRVETTSLLQGLQQLPMKDIPYKSIVLHEFDLDGALVRHPQLLLVDELAHTNAPTCRHLKRYQDIAELLDAGINVYTTVNVQHLESLNDVIASITGITVQERIPDAVFDTASQVELVDIEPQDLIERLEAGKVYTNGQARKALEHFFTPKNLAALREIALRRSADRLNTCRASDKVREHIMTCISASPSNAKVIRTAARMAEAFHSDFTALLVQTRHLKELQGEPLHRLQANIELAQVLGARVVTVHGEEIAQQIAEYAQAANITKIVIGRPNPASRFWRIRKTLVEQLTHLAPTIDTYIIPDNQPPFKGTRHAPKATRHINPMDIAKSLLPVALATIIGYIFTLFGMGEENIITVYILGVLVASVWTHGRWYGAFASLVSVVAFNFFFTNPRFTLQAYDPNYPVTFIIMFIVAFITSSLASRVQNQARISARKAYRTQLLLEISQKLQMAESAESVITTTATQASLLLGRPVAIYHRPPGTPQVFGGSDEVLANSDAQAVAQWVMNNNHPAGAGTDTLPSSPFTFFPIRGAQQVLAVMGYRSEGLAKPDGYVLNLLEAMLGEGALALEKIQLDVAKQEVEIQARQESLRANLLRTISHDLRTPLTTISGNASVLLEEGPHIDETHRLQLCTDIYDDSQWLIHLVENLLSITRMENGTLHLHMEEEVIDDVVQEALSHLDRNAKKHHIEVNMPKQLLLVRMDARLIIQVLINLLNNAIFYTPEGSHILVSARKEANQMILTVADDGPGIDPGLHSHLFDMFWTAENTRADGRRGMGLGLSLCKTIVQAHAGTIGVMDNTPHGTIFLITIPCTEVPANE